MFKILFLFSLITTSVFAELYRIGDKIYSLEEAITPEQQQIGLMYRDQIPNNGGMIFIQSKPRIIRIWMKNTFIPLDIIFVDSDNKIQYIHPNTTPMDESIISFKKTSAYVIELNGGTAYKNNIKAGDEVQKVQVPVSE